MRAILDNILKKAFPPSVAGAWGRIDKDNTTQCNAVQHYTLHTTTQPSTTQHSTTQHNTTQHSTAQHKKNQIKTREGGPGTRRKKKEEETVRVSFGVRVRVGLRVRVVGFNVSLALPLLISNHVPYPYP